MALAALPCLKGSADTFFRRGGRDTLLGPDADCVVEDGAVARCVVEPKPGRALLMSPSSSLSSSLLCCMVDVLLASEARAVRTHVWLAQNALRFTCNKGHCTLLRLFLRFASSRSLVIVVVVEDAVNSILFAALLMVTVGIELVVPVPFRNLERLAFLLLFRGIHLGGC